MLRRLLWTVPVLLVSVTIAFFATRAIGGNPFRHGTLVGFTGQGGWVKYGDPPAGVDREQPLPPLRARVPLVLPCSRSGSAGCRRAGGAGGRTGSSPRGLLPTAWLMRLVRGSMLETMQADYVRAAAAKGLRRGTVIRRHVLRNSLVPAVTAAGPLLGLLVTGSFVVEHVFAIPGIGRYFVTAVVVRDIPVVLGLTVLLTAVIVLANLVADVLHGLLDPRVREGSLAGAR